MSTHNFFCWKFAPFVGRKLQLLALPALLTHDTADDDGSESQRSGSGTED